jgi:hypothetical protein
MVTYVREFSVAGPCIVLGELIRRTARGVVFRNRNGAVERRLGQRVELGLVHAEPCQSCRDHAETMYGQGWLD